MTGHCCCFGPRCLPSTIGVAFFDCWYEWVRVYRLILQLFSSWTESSTRERTHLEWRLACVHLRANSSWSTRCRTWIATSRDSRRFWNPKHQRWLPARQCFACRLARASCFVPRVPRACGSRWGRPCPPATIGLVAAVAS